MKHGLSVFCVLMSAVMALNAQDTLKVWTLQECLDYALENNIQLRQSRNTYLSGVEDTKEAKAAMLPSLAASTSHNFTNYPSSGAEQNNVYTGTYGVNAELTIYSGGRLRTALKQQQVQNSIDQLSVDEAENDIRIAILQAYMNILYASEAVEVALGDAATSRAQCNRAEQMWKAGSISKVDYAQLQSQLASDEYQAVVAQSSLDSYKLQLKQLLELGITEEIEVSDIEADEARVLALLPSKADIYSAALETMPEVRRGQLSVTSAELAVKSAKSGFLPTLSMSASVGTGHMSGAYSGSGSQIWNRFNENVGLTLSVPIFSNRKNRTAVNKARIALSNSILDQQDIEKTLLKEVESAYLDAVSAQSRYVSAVQKQQYAQQSYELTDEQFRVGMKNTVELIAALNELSSARQEVLQAKYMSLLNIGLLDIYQGK